MDPKDPIYRQAEEEVFALATNALLATAYPEALRRQIARRYMILKALAGEWPQRPTDFAGEEFGEVWDQEL